VKHILPSRVTSRITIEEATGPGSTTDGVISVSLTVTGNGPVLIEEVPFYPGEQIELLDQGPYYSVTYDATGSKLRIIEVN